MERLECKGYLIAVLNKVKLFSLGLHHNFLNLFVHLNGKLNVVECGEIGKEANVSSVYRRRIEHVKRKEVCVFALSEAHSTAGRKILDLYASVIRKVDSLHYISFENIVTRLVISLENRMSKVNDVALLYKCGIFCFFGFERSILMAAEMAVGTAEVGVKDPRLDLTLGLHAVRGGVGEEGCGAVVHGAGGRRCRG